LHHLAVRPGRQPPGQAGLRASRLPAALAKFQLEVVSATSSPATAALLYQSAITRLNDWVLPSV
jgi:hypothetical protein